MSNDNHGSQGGDHSLNVGVGDFRGANVSIGTSSRPTFTAEQMQIRRRLALGGRSLKSESVGTFGIVTGIASLIGLYFTLFQAFPQPKNSSWPALFMFLLIIGTFSFVVAKVMKRRRFDNLLFRKYYLEAGSREGLYLSSFTAVCPWCGSRMNLRNVGPKNGPRSDRFICERNPQQHTVDLDPTALPEIDED